MSLPTSALAYWTSRGSMPPLFLYVFRCIKNCLTFVGPASRQAHCAEGIKITYLFSCLNIGDAHIYFNCSADLGCKRHRTQDHGGPQENGWDLYGVEIDSHL